jgi:hypothetical protein
MRFLMPANFLIDTPMDTMAPLYLLPFGLPRRHGQATLDMKDDRIFPPQDIANTQ